VPPASDRARQSEKIIRHAAGGDGGGGGRRTGRRRRSTGALIYSTSGYSIAPPAGSPARRGPARTGPGPVSDQHRFGLSAVGSGEHQTPGRTRTALWSLVSPVAITKSSSVRPSVAWSVDRDCVKRSLLSVYPSVTATHRHSTLHTTPRLCPAAG